LGVVPAKARSTVSIHHAYLFGNALAIGIPLAALPVATTVIVLPGYDLSIPWLEIAGVGGGVALAAAASLALAMLRLRAASS
jgi:hypothetical protein